MVVVDPLTSTTDKLQVYRVGAVCIFKYTAIIYNLYIITSSLLQLCLDLARPQASATCQEQVSLE